MGGDFGAVAQLGERQLCKLDVTGSIPVSSITWLPEGGLFQFPRSLVRSLTSEES